MDMAERVMGGFGGKKKGEGKMIRAGECVSEIGGSLGSMGGCAIQAVVESHISGC